MTANTDVTAILLAAGRGRRFDPFGARNKLLQPLPGGDPVVVASARTLLAVFARVVAVVPPQDGGVGAQLRALGCDVTLCPQADDGMGLSLADAVRHSLIDTMPARGWLVALGDMPFVSASTLQALAGAIRDGAGIAAPVFQGRRGNPVAFALEHAGALQALDGDQGARRLLTTSPVTTIDTMDAGILRDIDSPADLPS